MLVLSHFSAGPTPGGRPRVRRVLVRTTVAVTALALGAAAAAADPHVSVHEHRGVYTVAATFRVGVPASAVIAVLTDYAHIPRFMPDVRTSQVLERTAHGAVIEQEAVARFMMLSKRVHLVLDIREEPRTIRFQDLCGQSFTHYEGRWTVMDADGGTAVAYELTAEPAFAVPEFLLKRLLTRDARRMIESLQTEIAARAPSTAP